MPQKPPPNPSPLLVFDLGGTSFRHAWMTPDDRIEDLRRSPAIGRQFEPDTPASELQERLVEFVAETVRARRDELDGWTLGPTVGISLGAAMSARSGVVLGSAPLWGEDAPVFSLEQRLALHEPDLEFVVLNDVSAAATALAADAVRAGVERVAAVTVSTGIALRTIDVCSGHIPTDAVHGLQGEVGHLPAGELAPGTPHLRCDCGAMDHVSSFASGPGLARLAAAHGLSVEQLTEGVREQEARALKVLDAATLPLARVLLDQAVLDPACELVALWGGVIDGLGAAYRESLLRNLSQLGMYGVTDTDPDFFRRRIGIVPAGRNLTLRGAGYAARRSTARDGDARPERTGGVEWTVRAQKPVTYTIRTVEGVLNPRSDVLAAAARLTPGSPTERVVAVDANVDAVWGEQIRDYFAAWATPLRLVRVEAGEEFKAMETVYELARAMHEAGISRRADPVIAIGGGVLTDIVGLSTSLYRRGVPFVRVPTTLIGQVDAGVGIKTAVNFDGHKSRLGTYHAADVTLIDHVFLTTLDRRHLANGLSEIIKIALVKDRALFEAVERQAGALLDTALCTDDGRAIMARAVDAMLGELECNLWEADLERLADFGHTFSPAFEMHELPELLHGEAVALDMALSCVLSQHRGWLTATDLARILATLHACELPVVSDTCRTDLLLEALEEATRHRNNLQRLPLLTGIGRAVFVNDVTPAELAAAASALRRHAERFAVVAS